MAYNWVWMCSEHYTSSPFGTNHRCGTHPQWLHIACNSLQEVMLIDSSRCHMSHHVHSSGGDELDMTPHGWPVQHHDMQMDQFHCKPTNAKYSAMHICLLISSKLWSIAYSLNTHCDHSQNLAWAHVFFSCKCGSCIVSLIVITHRHLGHPTGDTHTHAQTHAHTDKHTHTHTHTHFPPSILQFLSSGVYLYLLYLVLGGPSAVGASDLPSISIAIMWE